MKTLLFSLAFVTSAQCYSQVSDKLKNYSEIPAGDTTLGNIAKQTIPPLELRKMKYISYIVIIYNEFPRQIPDTKEQRQEFRKMLKESIRNRDTYAD